MTFASIYVPILCNPISQMPQQKTSSLKTWFDEIEDTNGDDECKAWLSRAFDSRNELAIFVSGRREGGETGKYVGFLKGSFNFTQNRLNRLPVHR